MQFDNDLVRVNSTKLAKELNVTRSTVYRWKEGISKPTRRHLRMLEEKLGPCVGLILPENKDQREPPQEENEERFRQTARLVADGWLPPEHEYKGVVSRTPFDEVRETASQIVEELKDD